MKSKRTPISREKIKHQGKKQQPKKIQRQQKVMNRKKALNTAKSLAEKYDKALRELAKR